MARRIVTAREQHAMLSPWREASAPKKIYRGVRLTNLPPELHQKINDLQQMPMDESEVGQHLKIGPMLLDHLHNTPWKPFANTPDHLQYTGLGRHWSRRKDFAELAASNQVGPGVSVVLEADDPGEHHYDPDRPMVGPYGPDDPTEQENTLLPNTPLNVTSVRLPGKPFEEVLDDPYYHNMEQEYGHPYPGGPRPGVGGISHDPFAKNSRQAAAFDPMKVTNRLKGEFHDWFDTLPDHRLQELKNIEMHPFMDHHENNPVSHWPTVERFLKDKYPAAHRGFMNGQEDASHWLDDPDDENHSPMMENEDDWPEPYSSADHQKLGYDPQEIAAGMVLLHNRAHSGRQDSYLNTDKKRLVDIFDKRQQMQRQYEQRQTTARTHPLTSDMLDQFFADETDPDEALEWLQHATPEQVGIPARQELWDGAPDYNITHLHLSPQEVLGYANEDNSWRNRHKLPHLADDIARNGMHDPILLGSSGEHALISDGHHRAQAALMAGLDRVPVHVAHDPHLDTASGGNPVGPGLRAFLDARRAHTAGHWVP